jgi:apolipoprotein N-acyltransferase
MKLPRLARVVPTWQNSTLALASAILLILSFPNFEYWYLAWFALIPLLWAIEREKASSLRSFLLGWSFGTVFFFGTCWWLTYAPIHYAAFPPALAYALILIASLGAALFPALFAATLSCLLRRFGSWAILVAPFIWVFTEFARYWLTGNNWNSIAYSQAFGGELLPLASVGGVYLVDFFIVLFAAFIFWSNFRLLAGGPRRSLYTAIALFWIVFASIDIGTEKQNDQAVTPRADISSYIIAIQPNVPMSGLDTGKWQQLRQRQIEMAESEIRKLNEQRTSKYEPITVILPESPMNFMYDDDQEFRKYINNFAVTNNVSVLFNSAEPDRSNGKYFNSAVMIDPQGKVVTEYDKIYLLPFGEAVPVPFESFVPAFVGSFSYGKKYDLVPLGDAKAGIMICFESHFGELGRQFVQRGADAIIEMTNDGYLGPTPVLRQHLANAVFRAIETDRPVFRVTNVGITSYITETGAVMDLADSYSEATRVWTVARSDGSQTFYVKYGDWFAWLCSIMTIVLLILCYRRKSLHPTVQQL